MAILASRSYAYGILKFGSLVKSIFGQSIIMGVLSKTLIFVVLFTDRSIDDVVDYIFKARVY